MCAVMPASVTAVSTFIDPALTTQILRLFALCCEQQCLWLISTCPCLDWLMGDCYGDCDLLLVVTVSLLDAIDL
jgi:hypothetical protein